jgi:uracil phosphoribosyltransferase
VHELSGLLAYELTRDMPMQDIEIETPLEKMMSPVIDGKKVVLASILRAGNGFLDGMLQVLPGARVGHIGLYRDPATLQAVEYYFKMPSDMDERDVIVLDPMLATGNSAVAAVDRLKQTKPRSIRFVCLVSPARRTQDLPRCTIPTCRSTPPAVDRGLNEHGYIVPGPGRCG